MGFSPQQVGRMSFWQFHCCLGAVLRSRQPPDKTPPPPEPSERLVGMFKGKDEW